MSLDVDRIKKIIDETTDQLQRGNLIIMLRAYQQCRSAYAEEPTQARRRNWQDAEAALAALVAESDAGPSGGKGEALGNLAEVLAYLQEAGWRVTKSTLYRHQGEGKILPRNDGAYHLKDVEKYAKTFLKQAATGKRIQERMDDLQYRKEKALTESAEMAVAKARRAEERERWTHPPREVYEQEFAALAGTLEAALKSWLQSEAPAWIRLVNGDNKKVGELTVTMMRGLDELTTNIARLPESVYVFKSEEIQTDADEEDASETIADEEVS